MKTKSIMYYVVTLFVALSMSQSQSVMAKGITNLGYHYSGINNGNIQERKDTYVPKLEKTKQFEYIILDKQIQIDNEPVLLNLKFGHYANWDSYFSGADSLLILVEDANLREIGFYLQTGNYHVLNEGEIDKIENFDNVIKEKILPYISLPNRQSYDVELAFYGKNYDDLVKVFSVKNGVISGRKQVAAAEKKAKQAQEAKDVATYKRYCKKYGQKYVDAAIDKKIIIGMPVGLMKEFFKCDLTYESASLKQYKLYNVFGGVAKVVWVKNGRVSSISNR